MDDFRQRRKDLIVEFIETDQYKPMKEKELAVFFQVKKTDREIFRQILVELMEEGRVVQSLDGRYRKADGSMFTGTFLSGGKGFGFVQVEGFEEELFVPEEMTAGAFHKDTVLVTLLEEERSGAGKKTSSGTHIRRRARVIRVVKHGILQLVGTFEQSKGGYGFVIPDNPKIRRDIFVPTQRSRGAVSGHKVIVEITDYGNAARNPEGKVQEILGHINDPGVDILSVVRGYELPLEFPEKVLNQVERVAVPVSEADRAGRRDLRDVTMVTIDGEDAKDLDDAVSVDFDGTLYHLGVHIADVTNYVQENSALDREALKRGTSVYLTDRVIPMLPHALSNGICSLNAGEDRLALSCLMIVNLKGEIKDYEICESVIRVDRRMSYTTVRELLEGNRGDLSGEAAKSYEKLRGEYEEFMPMFLAMEQLAALLRERRKKRGSIDFDFPECKISLDENGHPIDIRPYEKNVATDLIEDFMLAANETVAQHFYWMDLPFVYRVHDVPDADRMHRLSVFINNYGYYMKSTNKRGSKVGSEEVHPKEIQRLLERVSNTPQEPMIARLCLRSMKQAKYSTECSGHFGLACRYYCHFTSPIRRYPDLQIHRIIKEQLRGRLNEERIEHYRQILPEVAKQASRMERCADEAERETDKLEKVEYMEDRIGQEFDGVISGVTAWGIYVELSNTVEGMVHVSKLPGDYYYYREASLEMVGEATGRCFQLGMPVRIRVDACDKMIRTIDFSIVEVDEFGV